MKKKYTKEIHAARLIEMLERKRGLGVTTCPAGENFIANADILNSWGYNKYGYRHACEICKDFLSVHNCPCFALNSCAEAAKQTWLKLEEEGFI